MKKYLALFLLFAVLSSCTTNYYVVRHAEKASEPKKDPRLTDRGEQRAENLVSVLRKKKIEKVYSSNFKRTMETVMPTAESKFLEVESYDPSNQTAFIEKLKAEKKNALIAGHSNTIRYIINGLYEQEILPKDLDDMEYGDVFIIKRAKNGKPKSYTKIKF
ncbi:Histidine phosphatase superfamily (branch 1) [Spirosomataceae bacterium TFI 002]|nr:Histidine phosphatase superfamily (branch 1) [Spirosomataceae bacterium TFI 002]